MKVRITPFISLIFSNSFVFRPTLLIKSGVFFVVDVDHLEGIHRCTSAANGLLFHPVLSLSQALPLISLFYFCILGKKF